MTIVHEPGVSSIAYVPAPTVRRRRVILGLAGLVAVAALSAVGTASLAGWIGLVAAIGLATTYTVLLHRSRRMQMEREFLDLLGTGAGRRTGRSSWDLTERSSWDLEDWADLGIGSASVVEPEAVHALDSVPAWRQVVALVRFVLAYAAGWALAPLVFALTIAVGRTPRDTTGQRWLANLQNTQLRLRDQSMRTLVVSAAATASVTGVGAATVLGGSVAAVAAPGNPSYVVVEGDTLSSIAAHFGTSYAALAAVNHLADPNRIYPGQSLSVAPRSGSPAPNTYRVVAGDTLSSVAARFGTSFETLAEINGLANPNFIQVGQMLRLWGAPTPTSTPTRAPAPAPAPARAEIASTSSRAQIAASTALAQVGKPYVWAGAGPNDFDCSGLVMYSWQAAGVRLAHYTVSQYQETSRISQSQLQPGDLVFYDTGSGAQPGHVTVYIGHGQIVTADSPGTVVRVENLDWDGVPMGFGRVG